MVVPGDVSERYGALASALNYRASVYMYVHLRCYLIVKITLGMFPYETAHRPQGPVMAPDTSLNIAEHPFKLLIKGRNLPG